jgi:hypothetical protein
MYGVIKMRFEICIIITRKFLWGTGTQKMGERGLKVGRRKGILS